VGFFFLGVVTSAFICAACDPTIEDSPVCGSDGVTYPNPSYIFCANWENPGKFNGSCTYLSLLKVMNFF